MRYFTASLVLIALGALMFPCTHAEEHHDEHSGLCSASHADCHSCRNESCFKPGQTLPGNPVSSLGIPVRQAPLIAVMQTDCRPLCVAALRSPGGLLLLQTVRLLI